MVHVNYFDDIININDLDLDILLDEKSYKHIFICDTTICAYNTP